jgi:hypothetical protein
MKRRTRFAVSMLAATITFASLMVFAKPMHGFRQHDKSPFGFTKNHDCNRGDGVNSIQKNSGGGERY